MLVMLVQTVVQEAVVAAVNHLVQGIVRDSLVRMVMAVRHAKRHVLGVQVDVMEPVAVAVLLVRMRSDK